MKLRFLPLLRSAFLGLLFFCGPAFAQRPGGNPPGGKPTTIPKDQTDNSAQQPVFIVGKVMLEGGGPPNEPVAIERVCSTTTRREGYTDKTGTFGFQIGINTTFQTASENDSHSRAGNTAPPLTQSHGTQPASLLGCEFRGVLAGYHSSAVVMPLTSEGGQYTLHTIFLTRIGETEGIGATVSLTTMAAPEKAKNAFQKGVKAAEAQKLEEAEKELNKAVQIYPQFAAAWTTLADLHRQQGQLDHARGEYGEAIKLDPQYLNPTYGLAMVAMQEKKWDEVVRLSDQLIKTNSGAYPLAFFFNAAANFNAKNYAAAEESARKFKGLDNAHAHPDVLLLLSYVLARKQDYAGAAQNVREYLALVPAAPNAQQLNADAKQYEDLSLAKRQ